MAVVAVAVAGEVGAVVLVGHRRRRHRRHRRHLNRSNRSSWWCNHDEPNRFSQELESHSLSTSLNC